MKILWAFLCRSSAIDVDTNNISLFNILEDIDIPFEPPTREADGNSRAMAIGSFELVVAASRDNPEVGERVPTRVNLYFPDGSPPETLLELDIDLTSTERYRFRLGLPGLPIGGRGTYTFAIEMQLDEPGVWPRAHEVSLDLEFSPHEVD